MWNKTREHLPTKCCNVGTDWKLVKGFDANYITVVHVRAKAKALANSVLFLSQSRKTVQGSAPSGRNKLQMLKPNCLPNS